MNDKIKEVHDYFKNKIVNGDYEVLENSYHTMQIVIDSEYNFCLWMANGGASFGMYYADFNYIHCKFNVKESLKGFSSANKIHKEYKRNELLAQKRKELEALENELKK